MRRIRQLSHENRANGSDNNAADAQEQSASNESAVALRGRAHDDADQTQYRAEVQTDAPAEAVGYPGDEDHAGNITDPVCGAECAEQAAVRVVEVYDGAQCQ